MFWKYENILEIHLMNIFGQKFDMDPKVAFMPVIESKSPQAFLTEHPRDEIAERSLKIPFLTGNTYDEGVLKSAGGKMDFLYKMFHFIVSSDDRNFFYI